jgi:hexokinase
LIVDKNHAKLKAEVENLASSLCKAIKTEADNIAALICKSITRKTNVCKSKDVKALDDKI